MRYCAQTFRNRRKWKQDPCRKHGEHRCMLLPGHRWEHTCSCGSKALVRKWVFAKVPLRTPL